MLLLFAVILLSCSVVWLRVRWLRVRRFWKERGVPHYAPHPLMGSLTFLQRENPTIWMRQLYKEFKSPYVGMWLFWRPALVINCPELAKKILVKDADNFRNRFLSSGKTDPVGGLNLFTVNDPTWSNIRRRLTSVFTSAKLRAVEGIVTSKCRDLMERIQEETEKGQLIDLRKTFADYTTDVIGESAFGVAGKATKTGTSVLRNITEDFMKYSTYRGICWASIFFYPSLVDVFRFSFFPKPTTEFLRQVFRAIVSQRGGYKKPVVECKDFFDALLKIKQDALKDGEEISEDLLLAQAAIFLFGGFDSTSSSLTWITYELAHHPQCQEKLHQELVQAKQSLNGRDFDSITLSEQPYLNAVIKETLRKFPTMGWLDRIAANDYRLDDHLTISAGTVLYVNSTAMQMDPVYFPDPDVFDPERFMPENEKNIKPYTYMPFGEGPRICIGFRFAYQTLRFGMASLILKYRFTPLPNAPKPSECHIEKNGLFYMTDEKLSVTLTPRK